MCEKPSIYVGPFYNEEEKLIEMNVDYLISHNPYFYTNFKEMLIDSLKYEDSNYIDYSSTLQLMYITVNSSKCDNTFGDCKENNIKCLIKKDVE